MDEDFQTKKQTKLSLSMGDIEEDHEHLEEEVELSPVETIVWDCTEVISYTIKGKDGFEMTLFLCRRDPVELMNQKYNMLKSVMRFLKASNKPFVLITKNI
jgi:hypothetical protein